MDFNASYTQLKWSIFFAVIISVYIFVMYAIKILKAPYGEYEERYLKGASGKLDQMFIFLAPEAILYLKFIASFFLFFIALILFSGVQFKIVQYTISVALGIFGFKAPDLILKFMEAKRLEKFETQLLEGLTSLANSLKAGFSFPQALQQTVKESKPPFSQEFGLVLKESKLGTPLETALINITKRVESDDLELVVSSIVLTRELGGNLANIFERLAFTIRERMKLKGKIQALTSQGKMQGWVVGLMPLVLGLIISVLSPGMMDAFLNSIVGWILIGFILILEYLGAIFIKKIVTIDV